MFKLTEEREVSYLSANDYAQSANTLFHFVTKAKYLESILFRRAIVPRYCIETIDYLNISRGSYYFKEIAILQKCFCDIPFHKLADTFSVKGVGEVYESLSKDERLELENSNTHFSYYGMFAVAFSKSWGEKNKLQPIHYLNPDSQYTLDFIKQVNEILSSDDDFDNYSLDIINRLAYIKPLRGIMKRRITRSDSTHATVELYKNFHDECEWRYVPSGSILSSLNIDGIIANPTVIPLCNEISRGLENESYKDLWLKFSYDDIRYLIVPDAHERVEIIKTIMNLPDECFENQENIIMQKSVMISKIIVLSEIRKDW